VRYVPSGVPVEDLHVVWERTWPYLEKSIRRFAGVQTVLNEGYVLQQLFHKKMQLWICWDVDLNSPVGACLTEIVSDGKFPDRLVLNFPMLGGHDWNKWGDSLWLLMKAWGIEKGCTHAQYSGRRGWSRWYGFVECGTNEVGLPMFVRTLKR
tara:strand:+ start:1504 stop:1959 length:456 start_codon:yes stop_codon:yes gene_type:complete